MIDTGAQATVLSRDARRPAGAARPRIRDCWSAWRAARWSRPRRSTASRSAAAASTSASAAGGRRRAHRRRRRHPRARQPAGPARAARLRQAARSRSPMPRMLGGNRGYEIVVKARERLGQLIITSAPARRGQGRRDRRHRRAGQHRQHGAAPAVAPQPLAGRDRVDRHQRHHAQRRVRVGRELQIGPRQRAATIPIMFTDSRPFHTLGLADEPAMILGMERAQAVPPRGDRLQDAGACCSTCPRTPGCRAALSRPSDYSIPALPGAHATPH